jgi:hypothetical protein
MEGEVLTPLLALPVFALTKIIEMPDLWLLVLATGLIGRAGDFESV